MAKQMTDPVQTTCLSFEKAAEKKWFPYVTKNSKVCEVKFCDGSTKKYATGAGSNNNDVVVIGPGCKSSYSMGEILSITKGNTSHLVAPLISFSVDPTKSAIQKCFTGICDVKSVSDLVDLLQYNLDPFVYEGIASSEIYDNFALSDIHILNFMYAATILAYPKLAGTEAVEAAQKILSGTFSIPDFMFGSQMNKLSEEDFVVMNFSGFYPGWKDDFKKMSFFAECNALDPSNGFNEENNLLIYEFDGGSEVQRIFKENSEFQSFYHKHIVRSALSMLIRGGFANLLEAAFSVKIQGIDEIYEHLARFANDIGSIPCLEIIYGKREEFGVKLFENELEIDVSEHIAQWKAKPKADYDETEEITITYEKYKVKATVLVKGDDRILAGTSLSSYPFLEKTANRSWKIVEEKLIPDVISNFDNGEIRFETAEPYLYGTIYKWSELSKREIALITQKSADLIRELRSKPGYLKNGMFANKKLLAEVEKHIKEDGFTFEDTLCAVLDYWNSFTSMDPSLFTSVLETFPRKKDGSLFSDRKANLPISSDYWFVDIERGDPFTFNEISFHIWGDGGIHI